MCDSDGLEFIKGCRGTYLVIIDRREATAVPLLPLEPVISAAKTAIRTVNPHEWEAMIVMRPYRRYEIMISRRLYIRRNREMSDEIHVQPGSACYALTLDGARRKAQRIVKRLNDRDELDVPIARTVEVRERP